MHMHTNLGKKLLIFLTKKFHDHLLSTSLKKHRTYSTLRYKYFPSALDDHHYSCLSHSLIVSVLLQKPGNSDLRYCFNRLH